MLTDLQKRKLAVLFHANDANRDGFLEQEDFERIADLYAQPRGWQPGSPGYDSLHATFLGIWQGLRESAHPARADRVTLDEMLASFDRLFESGSDVVAQWSDLVCSTLDADGDGKLGVAEYRQLLATASLDAHVADQTFPRLDLNSDGYITKEELNQLFDEFFLSDDPNAPGNWLWGPY